MNFDKATTKYKKGGATSIIITIESKPELFIKKIINYLNYDVYEREKYI